MSDHIKQFKLHDSKHIVEFNEKTHRYKVDGEYKLGVTTILNVKSKPQLMLWPMREAITYIKKNFDGSLTDNLLEEAESAHRKKSTKGADSGTIIHDLIKSYFLRPSRISDTTSQFVKENEEILKNKEVDNAFSNFLLWFHETKPKVKFVERVVYAPAVHQEGDTCLSWYEDTCHCEYAGTLDLVAELGDELHLIDFKTHKASPYRTKKSLIYPSGVYDEAFLQAGGYDHALKLEFPDMKIDRHTIINLAKHKKFDDVGKFVGTHVRSTADTEQDRQGFLNALGLKKREDRLQYQLKNGGLKWVK